MIVDTSALMAIIGNEPERAAFVHILSANAPTKLSAGSLIELQIVAIRRRLPDALRAIALLIEELGIVVVPTDEEQASLAGKGFEQFGQGSATISALNFGDCFAYALAKATGEPLLFKGDDFSKTDIAVA
jgi:ribonuclease VapC